MYLEHLRFQETKKHTKSIFKIDGDFKCFLLEDGHHDKKVYGETRIPGKKYKMGLRTEGGMHEKYLKRYGPEFHKGMLWIKDIHNFKHVYIHVGNTPKDTLGCPLTGFLADSNQENISHSRRAYELIYPTISAAILNGEDVFIHIKDL